MKGHGVLELSLIFEEIADRMPNTMQTSTYFHKLFAKAGGYGLKSDYPCNSVFSFLYVDGVLPSRRLNILINCEGVLYPHS